MVKHECSGKANMCQHSLYDIFLKYTITVIANAVIGNISSGSFASIILAPSLNHESPEETK